MDFFIYMIIMMLLFSSAEMMINHYYNKYAKMPIQCGKTGKEIVEQMKIDNQLYDINIEMIGGVLTDHYDSRNKTIRLSSANSRESSVSSVAVAAHEMGHAIQDAKGWWLYSIRKHMGKLTIIASKFSWIMILLGSLFIFTSPGLIILAIGIGLFAILVLFDLITLPVEIDASRRARNYLKSTGYFTDEEIKGATKVLTAAAYTYLASTLAGIIDLISIILSFTSDD